LNKISDKNLKTIGYTIAALIAFAANSVLGRMALKDNAIDASSFTAIRLLSGALMLFILYTLFNSKDQKNKQEKKAGNWKAPLMLFVYAITFSFAYISLDTGTGALVLFGAVQLTMIIASLISGHKLHKAEWVGIIVSFSGLAYLIYPTITTPSIFGFVLMGISGIAWGIYTLTGRGSVNPLRDTTINFSYTIPYVAILAIIMLPHIQISTEGIILAVLSGALASALGYTLWYIALAGLSATEAAVVQLSVPVIASIGGVVFLSESVTMRLIISCALVLGGILTVIIGRKNSKTEKK
jgi:drug/metabolite transporter (DMT)-like permease